MSRSQEASSSPASDDRGLPWAPQHTIDEEQQALRTMYRITADRDASFGEKTRRLIALGRDYLDLPYGHLTRIREGTQQIVEAAGGHPRIEPGATCPLSRAYCRKTIEGDGFLAIQNAPAEGWADDPAYDTFELAAYIGAKVRTDEALYGTLCFAASEPRDRPFTEGERTLLELMARWISYELDRQRATEQLRAQNQRLDRFAGVVAHDLRNPLNVAKGRLVMAREEPDADHLDTVGKSLDRMEAIIEDLLTLTWGRQGIEEEALEPCPIAEAARTCWGQVPTPEATLAIDDPPVVRAEEGRLHRLLENLFRNAVEHGGEAVTVRVGGIDDGFFVADDGPGIPPEQRDEVLEAGHSSTEEGTGLGLSIVKTVAQAHDWSLTVTESREGGARFEVRHVNLEADGTA